jgi:hypothetical protein
MSEGLRRTLAVLIVVAIGVGIALGAVLWGAIS